MRLGQDVITSQRITATVLEYDHELAVEKATVTLDESWSPYGQATLVVPATGFHYDPTETTYVALTLTQEYGRLLTIGDLSRRWKGKTVSAISDEFAGLLVSDFSDAAYTNWSNPGEPYAITRREFPMLLLRSREVDHAAGTMTLTLATLDALLHDHAHVSTGDLFAPEGTTTVLAMVLWMLGYIGVATIGDVSAAAEAATVNREDNPWRNGSTAWKFIEPVLQRADLRLWCDEAGVWHLREDTPVREDYLDLYGSTTITGLTDRIDLDSNVVESVLVVYQWTDAEGVSHTAYDPADGPNTRLPYVKTYYRPFPGVGAADRILRSRLSRNRDVPVSAVSDYRAQPGADVFITAPRVKVRGFVRSVSWSIPDDEMQIVTRDIQNLGGPL